MPDDAAVPTVTLCGDSPRSMSNFTVAPGLSGVITALTEGMSLTFFPSTATISSPGRSTAAAGNPFATEATETI